METRPNSDASTSYGRLSAAIALAGPNRGRDCRDAYLGLMKTCDELGAAFWNYLGDRLATPDAPHVPPLPDLIEDPAAT